MKKILSILILVVLITSCHEKASNKESYAFADMSMEMEEIAPITRQELSNPPPPPLAPIENAEVIKKKIIKDGRMGIEVSDLKACKVRVDSLLKFHGAYYSHERFNNTDWESSITLTVRIPQLNFEKFISDLESGDELVKYKEIDARDVTDQFIDVETRLKNKRSYLKRYNELLKKAKSVKDILEIEEKIRGLEEEIESAMGRLKYLSDQVSYSTLHLTISKKRDFKYNPAHRDSFLVRTKQALVKGWFGFVDFLLFAIKIWPFWIVASFIVYSWRKLKLKRRRKNKS